MIVPPTVGPLWGSEIQALSGIQGPTAGPLWGSEIQPEPTSSSETSGEQCNRGNCRGGMIFPGYCWPSLGLGNTARADILGGDVWGKRGNVVAR